LLNLLNHIPCKKLKSSMTLTIIQIAAQAI